MPFPLFSQPRMPDFLKGVILTLAIGAQPLIAQQLEVTGVSAESQETGNLTVSPMEVLNANGQSAVWRIEAGPNDRTFYIRLRLNSNPTGTLGVVTPSDAYSLSDPIFRAGTTYEIKLTESAQAARVTRDIPITLKVDGVQQPAPAATLLVARPALPWATLPCVPLRAQVGTVTPLRDRLSNTSEFDPQSRIRVGDGSRR